MEFHNDVLLQLVECIESTQNEVKKKMITSKACDVDQSHMMAVTRESIALDHEKILIA
jgi:hypothetical protein